MTRDLPPGMVPLAGRFQYRTADAGVTDLEISHGQFSLWKNFNAGTPQDGVALNILIATHGQGVTGKDGEDMYLSPALTVEWLDIQESDLVSRDQGALHGYRLDYQEPRDLWNERPAALYDDSYGSTSALRLDLTRRADAGYRLMASAEDEFGRRCEIEADLPFFTIGASNFTADRPSAVEDWLTRNFDPALLNIEWQRKGSDKNNWQVLHAAFKEI